VLRRIEFSRNGKRYSAQVLPFPPIEGQASYWFLIVDRQRWGRLFEARPDDAANEAFEDRLIEAFEKAKAVGVSESEGSGDP
jgi:hypothetical protein